MAVYTAFLVYSLVTHRKQFAGLEPETSHAHPPASWSTGRAASVLAGATAAIAWISEILVGVIEPATERLGLNDVFVGVFVVAILGNAAEHSTAIVAAMRNRMDLSLSIAIGSSVQVALFVAPVLVLASLFLGPAPMNLAFPPGLVLIVLLSVLITGQLAGDGRSDWLKGVQLLVVYLVLALAFFFLPSVS
jgi:Ca2+:H+ antiporter